MFKPLVVAVFALATIVVASPQQPPAAAAPAAGLESLSSLFPGPSVALSDTNGDNLSDAVAARVIVPSQPTADDVEAAANIAARLGYETTALSLPLVLRDDEVKDPRSITLPILVGRENAFVKALVERGDVELKTLQPGQGLVRIVRVAARRACRSRRGRRQTTPARWRRPPSWRRACQGCGT